MKTLLCVYRHGSSAGPIKDSWVFFAYNCIQLPTDEWSKPLQVLLRSQFASNEPTPRQVLGAAPSPPAALSLPPLPAPSSCLALSGLVLPQDGVCVAAGACSIMRSSDAAPGVSSFAITNVQVAEMSRWHQSIALTVCSTDTSATYASRSSSGDQAAPLPNQPSL